MKRRNWPDLFTKYRNMTLSEIAQAEGVSKAAVCQAAKRHGRTYLKGPYLQPKHDWARVFDECRALSSAEIAKLTGVTRAYISAIRSTYT